MLSVVMPVYNEIETIDDIVARVRAVPVDLELIIVDDASSDGTLERLAEIEKLDNVRVILHEENQGKGIAKEKTGS